MTKENPAQTPQAGVSQAPPANDSASLIAERRTALRLDKAEIAGQLPGDGSEVWGLALSGGGIRSATFSLGLLRGLARQKLLNRFDVLSTVSGGGYVGSMLGRLYDRQHTGAQQVGAAAPKAAADQVQDAMADAESTWFGWWLRSNGRYLAPAGFTDRLFAITLYLRNLLALHFEFGLLAVLAGSLLAALDLGVWQALAASGYLTISTSLFDWLLFLKPWLPTAWLALLVVLPIALHLVFTYWDTQWVARQFAWYCLAKVVMSTVLVVAALQIQAMTFSPTSGHNTAALLKLLPGLAGVVVVLLATSALHAGLGWRQQVRKNNKLVARGEPGQDDLAQMRNRLTRQLMVLLGISLLILGLGIAERLAWLLAFQTRVFETLDLGILLAVATGVAQALMLSIGSAKGRTQQPEGATSRIVPLLLQLAGYLLATVLFIWWVSLVLKISFDPVFPDLVKSDGATAEVIQPRFGTGWLALFCVFGPAALYVAATGSNLGFLNLSSLHTFYKARLVRSYLGATNNARFSGKGALSALATIDANELTTCKVLNVGKVAPGDDVALANYRPHQAGGPVHIINNCVNQTADPTGRLFNQDRKGLLLSVRAGGDSRLSQEGWRNEFQGIGKISLGGWLAISGAAAAPGLGARTRHGLAALLTLAGVRLGYWLSESERGGLQRSPCSFMSRALAGISSKSMALLRELSATFAAGPKDNWYLSDGGHFENTGVYPLLLERASVIVLADCGADPGYSFEDVENLVRKARIDLDITITFRQPCVSSCLPSTTPSTPAGGWDKRIDCFGTLQDLAKDDNESCLALATIQYPGPPSEQPAILILVKPNTCRSVSMDVANYKRQNPVFPQETTGDQFFSESQWESYFSLGSDLGAYLSNNLIEQLRTHLETLFGEKPNPSPSLPEAAAASSDKPAATPASRSVWGRQVGAVGATLGAGAILSLGVAAWQSFESYRSALNARTAGERTAFLDIAQLWEKLPPGTPASETTGAANRLAVALLRAGDAYCTKGEAGWLMNSEFGMRVIADAVDACAALKDNMGRACQVMVEARSGLASMAAGSCLVKAAEPSSAVYWGYDYSAGGTWNTLHPCSPQREAMVEQYQYLSTSFAIKAKDVRRPDELVGIQEGCGGPDALQGQDLQTTDAQLPPTTNPSSPPAEQASIGKPEQSFLPKMENDSVCQGITIYMQIYGPHMRDEVRLFRDWWHGKWQASVPPIEDVVASAFRAARPAPAVVEQTTVRYHDDAGKQCASAIVGVVESETGVIWQLQPLSPAFKGAKGVIEVWFRKGDPVSGILFKRPAAP